MIRKRQFWLFMWLHTQLSRWETDFFVQLGLLGYLRDQIVVIVVPG
jgi:hypothetical protein